MQKVIVVGAGGFAREVLWLIEEVNRATRTYEIVGLLDDNENLTGQTVNGYPVRGRVDEGRQAVAEGVMFIIAVGEPEQKRNIRDRLRAHGAKFATVVDPSVRADWQRVVVGEGCILCAGVILTSNIALGDFVTLDRATTVGHDTGVGSLTTAAPRCVLSGGVSIGEGVYLGTGCAVRDGIKIGDWSIAGMGAVVTKDLPPEVVAVGVPAKVRRTNVQHRVWQ